MTVKVTFKRVVATVLVLLALASAGYAARWSYQRNIAAAMAFNYLAAPAKGSTTPRADVLEKLIIEYDLAHPAGK